MRDLINSGDVDGFAEHVADDFVEHEQTPGLAPGKDRVKVFFHSAPGTLAAHAPTRAQAWAAGAMVT